MATAAHPDPINRTEVDERSRMTGRPSEMEILVVSTHDRYRRLAVERLTPSDVVLEIGCNNGGATRILATTGARVVAVDKSASLVRDLKEELKALDNVTVACVDGRDVTKLLALLPDPTAIFIDIGGDARLDHVALQLRLCLLAFHAGLIVVRSIELATLASLIGCIETPRATGVSFWGGPGDDPASVSSLLYLSRGSSVESRVLAVHLMSQSAGAATRERLREMLSDPNPRVRKAARWACAHPPATGTGAPSGNPGQ